MTEAEPLSVAALGLVAVAAVYLCGVRRLRARGDRWPISRTVLFLLGLASPSGR